MSIYFPASRCPSLLRSFLLLTAFGATATFSSDYAPKPFFEKHCGDCHDAGTKEGGLDLMSLKTDLANPQVFATWVKIHDRIRAGEMPPPKEQRPPATESEKLISWLRDSLIQSDLERQKTQGRTTLRRLTRAEYENTVRDLLALPGIPLQSLLPADGSTHGFDKHSDALDMSHVQIAKYAEAADEALDMAIAVQPQAPSVYKKRLSMAGTYIVDHILMNGDAVLLKDKKPDPNFLPSGSHKHIGQGEHEKAGVFSEDSTVGMFRHDDESFQPMFAKFAVVYPGRYRIRASLWSFFWNKGEVLPAKETGAARLSAVKLRGNGHGSSEGSRVLNYFDAPSMDSKIHEFETWLNYKECIGFNTASLVPITNYNRKGHAMAFEGPGIASDWLEIEGPINDVWPPESHRRLFGELPLQKLEKDSKIRPPQRVAPRQEIGHSVNKADVWQGTWTVISEKPLDDARRLLAQFLTRAFRHPVDESVLQTYLDQVKKHIDAGECFETAMRWTYRAALCSPDFLYRVEKAGPLDENALAARLSYFLWNSAPDADLLEKAAAGTLRKEFKAQTERLLKDKRSDRFVEDFLGQWLSLHKIASTDPDRKLYPEFNPYLQDSMRDETLATFRELLDKNLDAVQLVRSNFCMLNQKLAEHYKIPGVVGTVMRRVELPPDSPRGGFLTQAALLKITANGTVTSPVVRGAFITSRILGNPIPPPPADVPVIEPDVRGAHTIREQLDLHRSKKVCASCHAKFDPAGFALESFDVIGGWRERYRSTEIGDPVDRKGIDPNINIRYKWGPPVDSKGQLPDGRAFDGIRGLKDLLASKPAVLLRNLTEQLVVYSTGREPTFADRDEIERIVKAVQEKGGGVRTLIHELVSSPIFQSK